jgi:integrase
VLDRYTLRYFDREHPSVKRSEVTPQTVAEFEAWLRNPTEQSRRKLAASTRRGIMAPLRAMFATAVGLGLIGSNPAREIRVMDRAKVIEHDEDDVRVLERDQLGLCLRVVSPRWRTFFHLLAVTGLRISEAIALQWRDLHLDGSDPYIQVRRRIVRGEVGPLKSDYASRRVPIAHELVLALRELQRATDWPKDADLVFATTAGTAHNPSNIWNRVLKPAAGEAAVPWIGFHTFRHTCASALFAGGRNVVQVQRWLGHHSPEFTLKTYVHLF